jgi:phage terminase large subunit-like protein
MMNPSGRSQPSESADRATDYALKVVAKEIIAGPLVRMACQRHLDDLDNGEKRGLHWSPRKASRIYEFFERFLVIEETGHPFLLETWQCFVLGSLFGWLGPDGFRRFRTAYIEIGKGNGKTPVAAGLGLFGLFGDGEPSAEVYSAAPVKEQSSYLFNSAKAMAEASTEIHKRLSFLAASLVDRRSHSVFRPVSSEHRGLDGKRVHFALVDELHEHPTSVVVDKMRAGFKGRRQPLMFEITNSGYDRQSVCWDHHELSRQILERGLDNDAWFAYIAGLDEGDDWKRDPKCWIKANPNLGVSIKAQYLEQLVKEAVQMPAKENIVARLNFCQWTEQDTRAIGMEDWHACRKEFSAADLLGQRCFGGLDLSATTDLTCWALLFPAVRENKPVCKILATFWLPEARVDFLEKRDRVHYRLWAQQGFLQLTPGNIVDYDFIREQVMTDARRFNLQEVGYDPWNCRETAIRLQAEGIKMVEMRQGPQTMSEPTKQFLAFIMDGRLEHNGHPILTWNASNLRVKQDAHGGIAPDKEKSTKKIDGIVASIEAFARAGLAAKQTFFEPFII